MYNVVELIAVVGVHMGLRNMARFKFDFLTELQIADHYLRPLSESYINI